MKQHLLIPKMSPLQVLRFWARVNPEPAGCWVWSGCVNRTGYGKVGVGYRTYATHRIAYFLYYGEQPADLCVCHKCDNPPCCNPSHLFLGTRRDNLDDMHAKGRRKYDPTPGELNGRAKLTASQVLDIRASTLLRSQLAEKYGVGWSAIDRIIKRRSWTHL